MATSPSPDGASLLAGLVERFPAVLASLAAAAPIRRGGALAAAQGIIRRQAARSWVVEVQPESTEFAIRSAGLRIILGGTVFGDLLRKVVEQLENLDDARTLAIYHRLGEPDRRQEQVLDLLLALFLAHEFLHIEQQLGSDQYRDSDAYMDVVGAVDYQADTAAIAYVAGLRQHEDRIDALELLTLLMTVHIETMNAFATSMSRDDFDRLLVWHFQAARVARASTAPEMTHPALQQRPTISLPQFAGVTGEGLDEASFSPLRNAPAGSRLDMVVAAADGSGILRLHRLAATDDQRGSRLAVAVLQKRVGAVRQELEEFFLTHDAAMRFTKPDAHRVALEAVVAAGTSLVATPDVLDIDHADVGDFFDRAEFLIQALPRHSVDPTLGAYRSRWARGWRSDMETTSSAAAVGRKGAAKTGAVSNALVSEVRRVTIRLSAILDAMDEDG